VEAWEFWFDEPPSATACASLAVLAKTHSAVAIIEAIEITSSFRWKTITDEASRLAYINGILKRKLLESVAPGRAEEEFQIDRIQTAWKKLGLYTWPINRAKVAYWLKYCTSAEILAVMNVSRDWRDFRTEMDQIVARQASKTEPSE